MFLIHLFTEKILYCHKFRLKKEKKNSVDFQKIMCFRYENLKTVFTKNILLLLTEISENNCKLNKYCTREEISNLDPC